MTSQHQQQQDQKHFHTMKPTAINLMNLVAILSVLLAVYDGPASARSLNEPTSLLDQDTASNKSTNTTHEDAERFVAKTTSSYELSKQISPVMQLNRLADNSSITCNDGSSIGYYKRLNSHSKSWIIYLQGGGFCHSEDSCQRRWQRNPELMSSLLWPETKSGKFADLSTWIDFRCNTAQCKRRAKLIAAAAADSPAPCAYGRASAHLNCC